MKTKFIPLASLAGILLFTLPSGLRAADGTPAATPPPAAPGTQGGHQCGGGHHWHKHHQGNVSPSPSPAQ